MNAPKVTTRITRLSGGFCGALAILAGFIASPPQALVAAAPESIGVESRRSARPRGRSRGPGSGQHTSLRRRRTRRTSGGGHLVDPKRPARPAHRSRYRRPRDRRLAGAAPWRRPRRGVRRGPRSGRRQPAGRACGRDRPRPIRRNGSGDRHRSRRRFRRAIPWRSTSSPTGESRWRAPVRPPLRRELGSSRRKAWSSLRRASLPTRG